MVRSPLLLVRATSSSSKFLKGGASFRVSCAIIMSREPDYEELNEVPARAHDVFGANIASSITMNRYSSLKKVVNVLYAIVTPMRDQQVEGRSEIPTRVVVSSSDSRTIKVQHHTLLFRKRNSNCRARWGTLPTLNTAVLRFLRLLFAKRREPAFWAIAILKNCSILL